MHSVATNTTRMRPQHSRMQQHAPAASAASSRPHLQAAGTPRVRLPPFAHTAHRQQPSAPAAQQHPMHSTQAVAARQHTVATGQSVWPVHPSPRLQPRQQPPQQQPAFTSSQWPQPTISSQHRPTQATPRMQPPPQQMQQTPRAMRAAVPPPTQRAITAVAAAAAAGSSSHPIEVSPSPAAVEFPSGSQDLHFEFRSGPIRNLTITSQQFARGITTAQTTGRQAAGAAAGVAAAAAHNPQVRNASLPSHSQISFSQPTPRTPVVVRSPRTPRATAGAPTAAAPRTPAAAAASSSTAGFRPVVPAVATVAVASSSSRPPRRVPSDDPEVGMIEVRVPDDDPIVSQGAIPSARPFAAARQPAATGMVRPAALVPAAAAAAAASAPKSPARGVARSAFRSVARPAAQPNKRRIEQVDDDDFSLGSLHPMTALPRSSRVTVPPPPPTTTTASRPSARKTPSSKPAAKRRNMTTTRWRNPGPHVPFIPRTSPVSDFELDEPPPRSAEAAAPPARVLSPNEPASDALPAQQQMVDELDDELEGLSTALPAVPTAVSPPAPLLQPVQRNKPAAASSAAAAMPSVTSNTAQPQQQRQISLQQPRSAPSAATPQPASANPSKKRASRTTRTPSPESSSDNTDEEEVAGSPPPQRPMRQIRAQELATRAHQSNLKKRKAAEHRVSKRVATPRAPPPPPQEPTTTADRSVTPDLVPPPARRRKRTLIRPFREDSEDDDIMEVEPPQRTNSPVPSNVPVLPPIQTGGGAAIADAAGSSAVAKPVAIPTTVPPAAASASSARPRKPISAAKPDSPPMSAESAGLLPSQLSACTMSSYRADAARDLAPPVRGRPGAASDMDTLLADNAYLPPIEWSDRAAPVPAQTLEDLDEIDCNDLEEEEQPFRSSITIDAYNELATCEQNDDITAALKQCSDGHEEIDEDGNAQNSRYLQIAQEANMFSLDEAQQFLAMHQRDGSNELLYTTKCWSPTRGLAFDRVKARVACSTKRVVEFVGGALMTRKRHLELNHAHSDDCLSISAQWLTSIGYDGPDLVICSHTHRNRSSLIRFPADAIAKTKREVATESTKPQAERLTSKGRGKGKPKAAAAAAAAERPKPVQANINACVKPCVVVDRKKGVLYAVLVCTRRIFKNHELLMVRDLNRWSSDSHRKLTYSARRCHWLHARVSQGEEVLLRYVMDRMGKPKEALLKGQAAKEFLETAQAQITAIAQKVTAQCAAQSSTAAKDANLLPLKLVIELLLRNDVMPDGAKAHQMLRGFDVPFSIDRPKVPFVPVHPSVAFEHADCYHIKRSQLLHEEKGGLLERRMQSLPDCLPSNISADHHRQEYTVDERHLKWIIEHGADWSLIEICEIVDLSNPVRLFTVPSQPAFGVRAKKHIPLGMLLFTYAGMIGRQDDSRVVDSQYLYDIWKDHVADVMPEHHLPADLYLDAKTYGNVGRFVNDNRFRKLSYTDLEDLVNLETRWVFYQGQIHFVYYATRPIKAGEELITRYGDTYWQQMDEILSWYLETYALHAGWRRDLLAEMCKSLELPLPIPPPFAMESTGAMQSKPLPYSHRMRAMDVDPEDQRRKELQRDSILNDEDGIELTDQDEDQIELKSFITRREHHASGDKQYLVQLSSHVYPAWYYPAGLSEDLEKELPAFDAQCDAILEAGGSLPSPPPMPVPPFVPLKPKIVDNPEVVSDDSDPSSDEDEDPNYDPRIEMETDEPKSKQARKRGSSDGSKKAATGSHKKRLAVKPTKPKRKPSRP